METHKTHSTSVRPSAIRGDWSYRGECSCGWQWFWRVPWENDPNLLGSHRLAQRDCDDHLARIERTRKRDLAYDGVRSL